MTIERELERLEAVRGALELLQTRRAPEDDERDEAMASEGVALAPEGKTWVCQACGKTSRSRYGFDAAEKSVAMGGWDESCMLNCSLFDDAQLVRNPSGRVTEIRALPSEGEEK